MPQTPKLSPQQKVALVEKIISGEISRQAAAQSVGVSNTTVRQWLRIYEAEGPGGLTPREKSRHLTAEEKQAAVADYLAGEGSLFEICKKYGIRSPQNLAKNGGDRASRAVRCGATTVRPGTGAMPTPPPPTACRSCRTALPTAAITAQRR